MRFDIVPGLFHYQEAASREAQMAQHMAELEQLAKYRAKKIQFYKDWSDTLKREALQAQARVDELAAQQIAAMKLVEDPFYFHNKKPPMTLNLTPLIKPRPTRWQRFKAWICGIFSKT